jgi:predicted glycoside hydrolase/deacetylase ChbG (UPF0249 family)
MFSSKRKSLDKKFLIINADDFGWDQNTAITTIDLFEKGLITSATLMTGMAATDIAIEYAKANQDRFSFGLHFNIVDGHRPLAKVTSNSLVDRTGKFESSNIQRFKAICCLLRPEDIRREFEHQLVTLLDHGIRITHIDSHGHLHKFPIVIKSIKPILKCEGIRFVRIPQNQFERFNLVKLTINRIFRFSFKGFTHTDHFYMLQGHNSKKWFKNFLKNIRRGVTELGIHPGTKDTWRMIETTPLLECETERLLKEAGISQVNFSLLLR